MPKPADLNAQPLADWPVNRLPDGVRYDGVSTRFIETDGTWVIVTGKSVEELARFARVAGYPFDPAAVNIGSVLIPAIRREAKP